MRFRCQPLVAGFAGLMMTAIPAKAQQEPDYRSRTVYFLMADRFHAHEPYAPYVDPQYPDATNTVNCFTAACTDEVQWRKYWGGDIQGVIQKLDYLDHLGISAVWVTPLMENVRAYEGGTGYGTGYHGYWVQNYDEVNAHFGGWNDAEQLSRALHARGMRYIQDITLNHSNPNDNHVFGRLYQSKAGAPERVLIDSYANDFDPAHNMNFYKHYQDDPRCKQAETESDAQWTYWQLHHCLLADLSGYNQHDPTIADYLIDAGTRWTDHGVDDFRLDAVKFPFPEFIARYTHAVTDHLTGAGRPAPYIVGEWSNGGVGDQKSLDFANRYPEFLTNILDFQLALEINRFIDGDYVTHQTQGNQVVTARDLDTFLNQRVQAFQGRDDWQGTFIDNHDQIRTLVRLQKLGVADRTEQERRLDLATVLLLTVRGIPIICWGDEQYLAVYDDNATPDDVNTGNDDPWNRIGMTAWGEDTAAFGIIAALADLRKNSPAVWRGAYRSVYADDDVLVFARTDGDEVVLVAVNRGDATSVRLPQSVGLPLGSWPNLLSGTSDANGAGRAEVSTDGTTLVLGKWGALVVRAGSR